MKTLALFLMSVSIGLVLSLGAMGCTGFDDEEIEHEQQALTWLGLTLAADNSLFPNVVVGSPFRVDEDGCHPETGSADDSSWIWFSNVPQSEIWNQTLKVTSHNGYNQIHMNASGGLNGAYSCYYGMCTVKLCGKASNDGFLYNGWAYFLTK